MDSTICKFHFNRNSKCKLSTNKTETVCLHDMIGYFGIEWMIRAEAYNDGVPIRKRQWFKRYKFITYIESLAKELKFRRQSFNKLRHYS